MKKHLNRKLTNPAQWTFLLLSLLCLSACEDTRCIKGEGNIAQRTLHLQPFSKLKANGDFKVYITQGPTQQVEVKGEPNILDQVNTRVFNGKWKITYDDCVRRSKPVEVHITMPEIERLAVNGSGSIYGENKFTVTDLPVEVNGSGEIDLELDAAKVMTRVTGSGEVRLSGSTEAQHINISGSGAAEVVATNSLTVDLSGSGKVY